MAPSPVSFQKAQCVRLGVVLFEGGRLEWWRSGECIALSGRRGHLLAVGSGQAFEAFSRAVQP